MLAAGFVSVTLVGAATSAAAKPRDVVIVGEKTDPELQRRVSYADLNLALKQARKVLAHRIWATGRDLCFDLNGYEGFDSCTTGAIRSTDHQVAAAIKRAERKMAGLPVGPAVAISMTVSAQ
jgi:UrcA family protein